MRPALTTGDLRDDVAVMKHGAHCTGEDVSTLVGKTGDQMLKCSGCMRILRVKLWMLRDPDREVQARLDAKPHRPTPPPPPVSNWRCGHHPDEHVTWRGTGCRACAQEQAHKESQSKETEQ